VHAGDLPEIEKAAVRGVGRMLSTEITHFNQTIGITGGPSPSDIFERRGALLGDAHRCAVWDQIIVASPDSVRLILLSATLPNDANLAA
jgi:hypothetical protein